jgi:acetoin utilization deacetylase AcuC-like enzyme
MYPCYKANRANEKMKIVYSPRYCEVYASDPASAPGRIEAIRDPLEGRFPFLEPDPATEADLLLVHSKHHLDSIKRDRHLYEIACLAAGGALLAARTAFSGEPSFGLIRPPGHHASPADCWGFCFFNNLAVSLKALIVSGDVERAVILDFDLHFGDGTDNTFCGDANVTYIHPEEGSAEAFLDRTERDLRGAGDRDILAVSAGFDRGRNDWGDLLGEEDYRRLGKIAGEYAVEHCKGRRYALLEGGYNHQVLGRHVLAFLEGFG